MSSDDMPEAVEWNLFARELKALLQKRGYSVWSLQTRAGIRPEIVRRLVYSLKYPKAFPMLNPESLKLVGQVYELLPDEMLWLIAAILATSIEAKLMNRVRRDVAFKAAEVIMPILYESLKNDSDLNLMLPYLERSVMSMSTDSNDIDPQLALALNQLEQGQMDLHVGLYAIEQSERVQSLEHAVHCFTEALRILGLVSNPLHGSQEWQVWYEEAETDLHLATLQLSRG